MSNATLDAISHITEVVTRVTRILSGKQIKVVQQGMKVGVDYDAQGRPSAVYLPSLTENPSPELLTAIQGFLDKEVSTLLYTDFDARQRNQVGEFKKGMAKSLQDIIEDSRTEREMRKQFRGSASNFDKNHDFAVKEVLGPSLAAAKNANQRTAGLAFPAIRAACGDIAYEEFMDGKWEELGKLGGAILHYADEIQNVSSTEETFDLTRKIIQKMEEGDGEGDGDEEGDGDGEGEGEGSDGSGTGSGAGAGSDGSGDEGEGDDDGSGDDAGDPGDEAGKEGGESEDDADGDKAPPPEQDKVDLSKANKSTKVNKASKSKPSGMSGTSKGIAQFKDLDDAFEDMDFDTKMKDKIKKIAGTDAAGQGAYTPYTRQFDYVGPLPGIANALKNFGSSSHAKNILDNVDKNSHVIQQQIQKLFMAREMVRWEPGHKRGKINTASLYRLPQGDPRIFRRKIETNGRDVAVSLVIDMSGSMGGPKIQNACIAALMFSKVLSTLGIKHEISAFTTYSGWGSGANLPDTAEVNKMMRDISHRDVGPDGKPITYARVTPIVNYVLKGYNERLNEDIRRSTAMIPSGYPGLMSGNVDGESVEVAGRRLLAQKEKKKVMIVMSDGQPAADGYGGDLVSHLKSVVKNLTASGVEMLGLGLQDRSVSKFYPKFEIVDATDQIPTKILELTRKMVVGV